MSKNDKLLKVWQQLIDAYKDEKFYYESKGDAQKAKVWSFKLRALNHVYSVVKKFPNEIKSAKDLTGIPQIGKDSLAKIDEILKTGTLQQLQDRTDKGLDNLRKSLDNLMEVTGISEKTAHKLYKDGITNVNELKKEIKKGLRVNPKVKLGLKYYGKVQFGIPREETQKIEKYLEKQLLNIDPDLKLIICGSYRRGNKTSGDIDAIIYNTRYKTQESVLKTSFMVEFINNLTDQGFLLDHLTDKKFDTKYMGFCKYKNNPIRRIDFRMFGMNCLHSAVLYFTGPYELNQIMRRMADEKGMKLSEYGLFKRTILPEGSKVNCKVPKYKSHHFDCKTNGDIIQCDLIKTKSERQIFELVGIRYLAPDERERYYAGTRQAIGKD